MGVYKQLGNANRNRNVFYVVRAATVAIQRRGKHAFTTRVTVGNGVMEPVARQLQQLDYNYGKCRPCRGVILKTTGATQLVEFFFIVRNRSQGTADKDIAGSKKT
jgi:hypothetical protein